MNAATHIEAPALHFMHTHRRQTLYSDTTFKVFLQQTVDIDESPPGEVRRAYNRFVNKSI